MEQPGPGTDFFLDGEPHVDPALLVAHYCATRGIDKAELGIRPVVLGTFSKRLTRYLAELVHAEPAAYWSSWQSEAYVVGEELTIATFGVGAPATISAMEEMIACGMRTLITTGSAGSLQPTAPIGTAVVPTSAIREEGTSHHYAPQHIPATPNLELASDLLREAEGRGIACQSGVNWTTDAPFREHKQKIARYRNAGVITVDMELSALFTVAAVRGVRCAAIVAVSDELHGAEWEIGFRGERYLSGMAAASGIALTVAARQAGHVLPTL